jgi:hypothetical protein
MKRRTGYISKRRIADVDMLSLSDRQVLSERAQYGGYPEHKRSPGNYGLTPPTQPRPGKTLCDAIRQIPKEEALELLRSGILKGMMSQCAPGHWPKQIWAVSAEGQAFEAQLENAQLGTYHGYPMPDDDDYRRVVQQEWSER